MEENDSTEVQYKIRQWSLPGDTIVSVLNVTSRVFWLELDDKVLLDSYEVLQEGILCEVFSQKCSAAWQRARGERLTGKSCCLTVRIRGIDSTSCCRKRICGLHFLPGTLLQKNSLCRHSAKRSADCRQSTYG